MCRAHSALQLGCLAAPDPSEPPRLVPQVGMSRCSGMQVPPANPGDPIGVFMYVRCVCRYKTHYKQPARRLWLC